MITGIIQKTICWLLIEEGQLTSGAILRLSEIPKNSVPNALLQMIKNGTVQREKSLDKYGHGLYVYALTRKCIDYACTIQRDEVKDYLPEETKS